MAGWCGGGRGDRAQLNIVNIHRQEVDWEGEHLKLRPRKEHIGHRGNYDKLTIKNMGLNLCENSNKASKTKCEKSCLKVAYNK